MTRIFVLYSITILLSTQVYADGPIEQYNVEFSEIPDSIMVECEGMLMLNVHSWDPVFIQSYKPGSIVFHHSDSLDIQIETLPISSFGYPIRFGDQSRRQLIGKLRYPILDKKDIFIKVLINCKTNRSVWLRVDKLKDKFKAELLMLDKLSSDSNDHFLVDPRFNPREHVRFYENPSLESDYKDIPQDLYNQVSTSFQIDQQVDGFIHIFSQSSECGMVGPMIEIGWLEIRDGKGRLNFWVKNIDDC